MEIVPTGYLALLRVCLAGLALFFAPGWLLQSLVLWAGDLPGLARIPISFAFSVGSIALLGIAAYAARASLGAVQILVAVWTICLLVVWLWRHRSAATPHLRAYRDRSGSFWPGVLIVLFALLCAVLAYSGGVWLSSKADGFYHLAAIRRQIDVGDALPRGLFYAYPHPPTGLNPATGTWHLVLSLFSLWSGVDITWLWLRLPALIAPLLVLAFYSFVLTLLKKPWLALLGTAMQFVLYDKLDFRNSVYPNQAGFILLWVALMLTWSYLDSGSRRELGFSLGLAVVMVSWHLLMAEFFFLALGAYLVLRWLVLWLSRRTPRRDLEIRRLLHILLPVLIVGLPLLLFRLVSGGMLSKAQLWWTVAARTTFRSSLKLGGGFSMISPAGLHIVDPRWRFAPYRFAVWLFAYLASPFLIPACLKRQRFAVYMLATLAVVPLVIFNPLLITFLQAKIPDTGIIRLVLLPAYGLMLAWFFSEQVGGWWRGLRALPSLGDWLRDGAWLSALGLIAGGTVLALMGYILARQGIDNLVDLYSPTSQHVYSLAASQREMRLSEQEPYSFLMHNSLPGAVVASDPEDSYYLGGLTGRSVIAVLGGHNPPAASPSHKVREKENLSILDSQVDMGRTVELLDKYKVCFVWVDSHMTGLDPNASRQKFDAQPQLFEKVYDSAEVTLYSYRNHGPECTAK